LHFRKMKDMKLTTRTGQLTAKILFATAYSVLAAEVFLRIFAPQSILPRYVCPTDYGIRGNEPNRSYWHVTPDYRINIRTNSKGIRANGEIPYEKPPGVKRIVVLGDSFGMGYGVDLQDTFTSQMARSLEKNGIKCEVVNLSVSGHGNAEHLVALKEEGLRYEPDLVLVAWNSSDPDDNIRANLFGLEDGRLVRRSKTYLPATKLQEVLFKSRLYRLVAEHSHLYTLVRDKAANLVKYKILLTIRRLSNAANSAQSPDESAVAEAASKYRNNLTTAILEEIRQQCASKGANLLILDIPRRVSRTEFKSLFPYDEAKDSKLDIFNPIRVFQQHKGDKLYWENSCGHFTPLGCRLIGEGLAEVILKSGLLNRKSSDNNTTEILRTGRENEQFNQWVDSQKSLDFFGVLPIVII